MLSRLCSRKLLGTGYHEAREGGKPTTEFSVTEIFPAQNYAFFFKAVKQKPKGWTWPETFTMKYLKIKTY